MNKGMKRIEKKNHRWTKRHGRNFTMIVPRWFCLATVLALLLMIPMSANAHKDDYLDETLVYLTLEKGEIEAEYWFDYGSQSKSSIDFIRHNLAMEWGITDHWMVDGISSIKTITGNGTEFDSGRVESRYRFMDEGALPVDIAISVEVNLERDEEEGSTNFGIEPRLILSKDFQEKLNFTLNLSEEIHFESRPSAFLANFGARYNWTQLVRPGAEFQYNTHDHTVSLLPQLWFAFPGEVKIKTGYSVGLDHNDEDFGRIAVEVEF